MSERASRPSPLHELVDHPHHAPFDRKREPGSSNVVCTPSHWGLRAAAGSGQKAVFDAML